MYILEQMITAELTSALQKNPPNALEKLSVWSSLISEVMIFIFLRHFYFVSLYDRRKKTFETKFLLLCKYILFSLRKLNIFFQHTFMPDKTDVGERWHFFFSKIYWYVISIKLDVKSLLLKIVYEENLYLEIKNPVFFFLVLSKINVVNEIMYKTKNNLKKKHFFTSIQSISKFLNSWNLQIIFWLKFLFFSFKKIR